MVIAALLLGAAVALLTPVPHGDAASSPGVRIPWLPMATGLGSAVVIGGAWGVGLGTVVAVLLARRRRAPSLPEQDRWLAVAPLAVELIAAATRAGVPPVAAVGAVPDAVGAGPDAGLRKVGERWRYGLSALELDLDRPTRLIARSVERAQETGAAPAAALRHAADELVADAALLARERARRVGVQAAVPLGVCLLPAFLCLGVVPLVASLMHNLGA